METRRMKRYTQFKRGTYYVAAVVIVVLVFLLPVITRLFSTYDLFFQMSAAVLGVVLSAVITFILLSAQSNKEMQQEREAKVYEQKLADCKDFLEHLRRVLEDGKVTPEEVNTLKFAFANLAVHVKKRENLLRISCYLQSIISECGSPEVKKSVVRATLQIVEVFQDEIYGATCLDSGNLEKLEENPDGEASTIEGEICEKLADMLRREDTDPKKRVLHELEVKLSAAIDRELWMVSCPNALQILCTRKGLDNADRFIIRLTWEDKHYFQCHLSFPDDDARRAFYLPMRAKLGGGFNKYCWWCYVEDQVERILTSEVASADDIAYAVDTCFRKLKDVVDYMTAFFAAQDKNS